MKIGLLGLDDPKDPRSYSGTPYHLGYFLRAAGHEVRDLGPYSLRFRTLVRIQNRLTRQFSGRQLVWERHRLIARQYPRIVSLYSDANPDLDLLLATSAFYIAGAKTRQPLVVWADTTVAGVIGAYPKYKNLSNRTIAQCHAVEQNALRASDLVIFSNQWAADVAVRNYNFDSQKVRVVTYGANLFESPDELQFQELLNSRHPEKLTCIIIGIDWYRKGVAKAIETVGELRNQGLDVRLQVIGCAPPIGVSVPAFVSLLGVIPKYTLEGRQRLAQLLGASHLLILPTVAECAAVVLAEANAFGVPVLTSDVGGNSSLVRQNINGILVRGGADAVEWANAAKRILGERETYQAFARRAYSIFHDELSWRRAVAKFEIVTSPLLRNAAQTVCISEHSAN